MFKHSSFRTSISLVVLLALIVACGAQPTAAPATSAPQPAATTAGTQPTTAAAQPSASGLVHSWLGLAYASVGETNKAVNANKTAMQKLPGQIPAYVNLCDLYLVLATTNEVVNVQAPARWASHDRHAASS